MENKYCDLHMHTIYSDGIFGVEEILKICENEKLSVIAITDHDSNESLTQRNIFLVTLLMDVRFAVFAIEFLSKY